MKLFLRNKFEFCKFTSTKENFAFLEVVKPQIITHIILDNWTIDNADSKPTSGSKQRNY